MNLKILPINVMLSHREQWLGNRELRAKIDTHLMGAALLIEVGRVHDRLAGQVAQRRQLEMALARLMDLISDFDVDHDDLARAIHFALEALIAAASDAAQIERYQRLQILLGQRVHEREALCAGAGRAGSAIDTVDIRAARLDWVNTVQTFLAALHLMNLDQETRERILSPLDASIAQALRSRAGACDGLIGDIPGRGFAHLGDGAPAATVS
jgi:hypothetical protein